MTDTKTPKQPKIDEDKLNKVLEKHIVELDDQALEQVSGGQKSSGVTSSGVTTCCW